MPHHTSRGMHGTLRRRSHWALASVAFALVFLTTRIAAADYPVEERLCDVAYQNCRTQILDLIGAEPASGSIDVAFWFMEDARYSAALINAFRRGVRVRVLFDTQALAGSGSDIAVRKEIIADLKAAGIPMRDKSSGGILHWKLMVYGAQNIAHFSAGNFSPDGYVPWDPYVNYEDEVVSFTTDPALVATFKTKYDDVWTTTNGYANYGNVTALERYYPASPLDPRMNFPPYQNYATRIVALLDQENQGIDIDMYRITDAKPADAVIRAVQRGATVRLYTEQQQYRDPTRLWHSYNVDRMWAAGVEVKDRAHQGLNHQKSVILRGTHLLIFGSSNWTTPSAASQLEHNIFTSENDYFDFFLDQFTRKWNNTAPSSETRAFVPLPPDSPIYAAPNNGATGQGTSGVTLKWNAGLWAHRYDIYLGTSPTLTAANLIAADLELGPSQSPNSYRTFTTSALQSGTTYYWKVVSKTMANRTAAGPVWNFVTSGSAPGGGALPTNWSSADIGMVGAAGNATYNGNLQQFVVSGSGADIWGPADEFRFAFTTMTGDGTITVRVTGISGEHAWTKAGVMMRNTLAADSAHASLFVSAAKGLAFQRRVAAGGLSTNTSGGSGAAPYWVRLTRSGNVFTASVSTDGTTWTNVASDTIAMNATIQVGLAVTSHADGTVATGWFDHVLMSGGEPPPPPPSGLPAGWTTSDVGSVSAAGGAAYDAGSFTLAGSGADIWGTADEFRYAYTELTGDGSVAARVVSVTNENAWTKAALMMRDGLTAGAPHAMMLVSAGKGLAFQRRTVANGSSTSTSGPAGSAPYWVKLTRSGQTFSAFVSADGSNWVLVGTDTIAMDSTIKVGLAVTSHLDGTLSTAVFDNLTIGTSTPPPPPNLPTGWAADDIGPTTPAGSSSFDEGTETFAVAGAGADIWASADAFQFVHTTLDGDGEVTARVASLENVDQWTKAGVMMRDGTSAGAPHASMFVTPATKGTAFQRRPVADGASAHTAGPMVAPPYWVKLVRQGTIFTAYTSPDGTGWTLVASDTIVMNSTIEVGLAITSHNNGTLATATFTNVMVSRP